MVADKDKIEQCVLEIASANGSVAVQTITFMMMEFLQGESGGATMQDAHSHLENIAHAAHHIAENPSDWFDGLPGSRIDDVSRTGRFNETQFTTHYPGYDLYYVNIGRVLKKLDEMFQPRFNLGGALRYLRDVEHFAGRLQQQIKR